MESSQAIKAILRNFGLEVGDANISILKPDDLIQTELDLTEGEREAAFYSKSPETIKYAVQPPRVNPQYQEIPTVEFAAQNGIKWTDGMQLSPKKRDIVWEANRNIRSCLARTFVEERFHNPLNCLLVAETPSAVINEKKCKVGKALFLAMDAEPLPPGTLIGFYSGNIGQYDQLVDDPYAMSLWDPDRLYRLGQRQFISPLNQLYSMPLVSSKEYGNSIRFVPYYPSEEKLETIKGLSKEQKECIATANLATEPVVHYGCKIILVFTTREVLPGEPFAFPFEAKRGGGGNYK